MANTEKVRLNKYLSQAGICSRREADVLIEGGKVSVNGKIADPGMRVNDLDKICRPYYPDAGLKPPDPPDVQDPRLWRSKHQTCACGKYSAGEIKPGRYSCSHRCRVKRAVL